MAGLTAFVIGATGEVGKELTKVLASNEAFSKIVTIGRRQIDIEDEKHKIIEQKIVDFEKLQDYASTFTGFDVGYCCLGTTRGKSGTNGFVKVDRDYVAECAQLAKQGGCKQFHMVTAQGSNKNSWMLYPRTKGEVEEMVTNMCFDKLFIYRPGLLLCDRDVNNLFLNVYHNHTFLFHILGKKTS